MLYQPLKYSALKEFKYDAGERPDIQTTISQTRRLQVNSNKVSSSKMKTILFIATAVSLALALPQSPKDIQPTATAPKATTPGILGIVPPAIGGFPFPDFSKVAHDLGFDPAKATPDPMG